MLNLPQAVAALLAAAIGGIVSRSLHLGLRPLTVFLDLLLVFGSVHVLTARRPSSLAPERKLPRYGRLWKALTTMALLGGFVLTAVVWWPHGSRPIPDLVTRIVNDTEDSVGVRSRGEFYLTMPASPLLDQQVATGYVQLVEPDGDSITDELRIPPGESIWLAVRFVASQRVESFFKEESTTLRLVFTEVGGSFLTEGGIPFNDEVFASRYVELKIA